MSFRYFWYRWWAEELGVFGLSWRKTILSEPEGRESTGALAAFIAGTALAFAPALTFSFGAFRIFSRALAGLRITLAVAGDAGDDDGAAAAPISELAGRFFEATAASARLGWPGFSTQASSGADEALAADNDAPLVLRGVAPLVLRGIRGGASVRARFDAPWVARTSS